MRLGPIATNRETRESGVMNTARKLAVAHDGLHAPKFRIRNASVDDTWPEVVSHYSEEEMVRTARENAPGRVFTEVFLILAAAGLISAAAILWAPISP